MLHRRVSSDAPLRRHISRPGHHVAGMVQHRPCSRPPPGRRLGRCTANHVRGDRQGVREHVNRTGCVRGSDPTDARSPVSPRPYPALTRARQDVNAEPLTAHERSGHAYANHVNGLAVAPTACAADGCASRVVGDDAECGCRATPACCPASRGPEAETTSSDASRTAPRRREEFDPESHVKAIPIGGDCKAAEPENRAKCSCSTPELLASPT